MANNTKNNNKDKVLTGTPNDMKFGAKTLAEGITFQVNVIPLSKEGKPLSSAELNKLRIGNGLGQSPNVSYGVEVTKAPKAPTKAGKGKAKARSR